MNLEPSEESPDSSSSDEFSTDAFICAPTVTIRKTPQQATSHPATPPPLYRERLPALKPRRLPAHSGWAWANAASLSPVKVRTATRESPRPALGSRQAERQLSLARNQDWKLLLDEDASVHQR